MESRDRAEEGLVDHRGIRIRCRGNRWRWRVGVNREVIQRSYESLDAALLALDRLLDERDRRQQADEVAAAGAMTIERLTRDWFAEKRHEVAPATADRYRIAIEKHIVPNVGHLDANLITEAELKAFYRTRTWKSAKESHKVLAMAFDLALDRDLLRINKNPCRKKSAMPTRRMCIDWWEDDEIDAEIRPVDPKTIPLDWQLEAMLERASTWEDGRQFWLYLVLASGTGARPGELCALQSLDEGWSPTQVAKYLGHRDDMLVRILYGNHLLDDTQQAMAESAYRALFGRDD